MSEIKTLEEVKEHFKNAKTVKCLEDGRTYLINVKKIEDIRYGYRCKDLFLSNNIMLFDKDTNEFAEIIEYKDEVEDINVEAEEIEPKHYLYTIKNKEGEYIECDLFDIANAMNLSNEQFTALRYFRKKGDVNKQINDTDKAIQCLKRHNDNLKTKN
jgi:hypothetical protein